MRRQDNQTWSLRVSRLCKLARIAARHRWSIPFTIQLAAICLLPACVGPVSSRPPVDSTTIQRPTGSTAAPFTAETTGSPQQSQLSLFRGQQPDDNPSENGISPSVVLAQDAEQLESTQNRLQPSNSASDELEDVDLLPRDSLLRSNQAGFDIYVRKARTGRLYFGGGYNSDLGVTGNVMIDERDFDYRYGPRRHYPRNPRDLVDDMVEGRAFRGGGQGFRMELVPGEIFERYTLMFIDPGWRGTRWTRNISAFYLDRRYIDWDEQRTGARLSWGYRLTHFLSLSVSVRAENVEVIRPRIRGVEDLESALGSNDLYSGRIILSHDTRDIPFLPTHGHFFELSYEQVFGTYDYPRGEVTFRKYFLRQEKDDGTNRHTLSYGFRLGLTGSETPIFENYFAGGFSTLRGFDFRGASPKDNGVTVGGELRFLGSLEYMAPITDDDLLHGVAFVDFGTVEENLTIHGDDFRVAVGVGLRVSIPMMGPAPLALDLAFPLARENTDDIRNFSFFFGFER